MALQVQLGCIHPTADEQCPSPSSIVTSSSSSASAPAASEGGVAAHHRRLRQLLVATRQVRGANDCREGQCLGSKARASALQAVAAASEETEPPVICRLGPEDFQEACDCANLWFADHENFSPTFGRGPSQVYRPESMHWHYGMRQNGRLLALVNSCPRTWVVGGVKLSVAGIGGVCSHPVLARGAGYIQALMNHVIDKMHTDNVHVSFLGGIRQRYAYYGYDKCGLSTVFSINRSNVRRYFAASSSVDMRNDESSSAPGIRSPPMEVTFEHPQSQAMLSAAQELQRSSPSYFERGDDFALLCGSGLNVAKDESGAFVGYLVASAGAIREIEALNPDAALAMITNWCLTHGEPTGRVHGDDDGNHTVSVALPPWYANGQLGVLLGRFAESVTVTPDHNWKILDWEATVGATLALRAATASPALVPGTATVVLTDVNKAIRLTCDGSATSCVALSDARAATGEESVVATDSMTAMRLLFGPLPPTAVVSAESQNNASRALEMLGAWCPLPLYTPPPDSV